MIVKWLYWIGDIVMENENKSLLVKKIIILILTLVGFITTVKLAIIYYNSNFNPYALPSFCSVNEFIDCDGIAKTTESQFFGVPLACWGLFLYSFITMLLFAPKLKNFKLLRFLEVFKNPLDYIASLGIISFLISITLLCISLFEIKKLCILCAFTYILNLLIALVALDYKNGGVIKAFKTSVVDMLDGLKIKKYLVAFIIVMLAAAGFLTYTSLSYVFTPQVKANKEYNEFVKSKHNKYAVSGNILGDSDAKVVIYAYTDYRCNICRVYNIMIHKAVKELKNIRVVHRNLPLDTECNKYLRQPFHVGSCLMARYAAAAEKQDKFWDINSLFFEKQPNNEEEILEIAKTLNLDIEKLKRDANSEEIKQRIQSDIEEATSRGIAGTPSTVIGSNVYVGIRQYDEFKRMFTEAGAEKR